MKNAIAVAILIFAPLTASFAAIVDQEVRLTLTVGAIGDLVPAEFQTGLSLGDTLLGRVTAVGFDDTIDGFQNGVSLINHQLTISGESFDSATNRATEVVEVLGGEVVSINFATAPGESTTTTRRLSYQTDDFWRITFPGWSLSSPTNNRYEITGGYVAQVIPVPAAVWLFGSALGMAGFAARRKPGVMVPVLFSRRR